MLIESVKTTSMQKESTEVFAKNNKLFENENKLKKKNVLS